MHTDSRELGLQILHPISAERVAITIAIAIATPLAM